MMVRRGVQGGLFLNPALDRYFARLVVSPPESRG